jgi:DNA-binding response OmpR family regulator
MKKILLVEDEKILQRAMEHALKSEGYEVVVASDGEEGLALAKKENPNLILLDLLLPKKDGFTVLTELKEDPATKNLAVIILSNLENSVDVEKALAAGATTYLVKTNYKIEEVLEKVKQHLQ